VTSKKSVNHIEVTREPTGTISFYFWEQRIKIGLEQPSAMQLYKYLANKNVQSSQHFKMTSGKYLFIDLYGMCFDHGSYWYSFDACANRQFHQDLLLALHRALRYGEGHVISIEMKTKEEETQRC
jgi:hypothetical protein